MAKGNKEECKVLNKYLEQLRASYVGCYREMTLSKKLVTVATFKKAFFGKEDFEFTLSKLVNYTLKFKSTVDNASNCFRQEWFYENGTPQKLENRTLDDKQTIGKFKEWYETDSLKKWGRTSLMLNVMGNGWNFMRMEVSNGK